VVRDASNNSRLREHRQQRFEPTLARHSGRLVKLPGDGALVEFSSGLRDEPRWVARSGYECSHRRSLLKYMPRK
jgi:class 3 adenylate cyclase